jgi:hypothetical protein
VKFFNFKRPFCLVVIEIDSTQHGSASDPRNQANQKRPLRHNIARKSGLEGKKTLPASNLPFSLASRPKTFDELCHPLVSLLHLP